MLKTVMAFALLMFVGAPSQAATVLITGANRGIGLEFAKQYADAGWQVIATARNPGAAPELNALAAGHPTVSVKQLDVTDAASIRALATAVQGAPIDLLINNAGILGDVGAQTLGSYDRKAFDQVMATNVFGPLAVSEALRANVVASRGRKIVAITSGAGQMNGGSGTLAFYSISKAALNKAMLTLGAALRGQGVTVGILSPGMVETDMLQAAMGGRAGYGQKPEAAIASMRKVIEGMTPANTATVLDWDGRKLAW